MSFNNKSKAVMPEKRIVLAGNPNVGKSTVFNALTGMHQHTGNWPGKTVETAEGEFRTKAASYIITDIPGTYSLAAHSAEEEVARDAVCFSGSDATVVVCDATCLERNLSLALQALEATGRIVVCVNLLDEAEKKGISLDLSLLEKRLGVSVVGVVARNKRTLSTLLRAIDEAADKAQLCETAVIDYPERIEMAIRTVEAVISDARSDGPCRGLPMTARYAAQRLIGPICAHRDGVMERVLASGVDKVELGSAVEAARSLLARSGVSDEEYENIIASAYVKAAETAMIGVVTHSAASKRGRDRRIDAVITSKWAGYPLMLALLALVFYITIWGANYPSELLSSLFFKIGEQLTAWLEALRAPAWLIGALMDGVYRVLATVVSVMLPPMAIFFPLFTLLEDAGYLPRVAYNLDRPFKRCKACGKQSLTMCLGFGCNAVGVTGCRIIDSPRERLLAILTNNFVPCNGRFPALISVIVMFFAGAFGGLSTIGSALILTAVIVLGVAMTFLSTRLLSGTLLRGTPSSFTLELPPYRRPQFARVAVRSIFDRTLFVLKRAVIVAAPAGLVIWLLANIEIGGVSLIAHSSAFLDPFASIFGLDGVILLAFILGLPANEIVFPIILMAYMANGNLTELQSLEEMRAVLISNGWNATKAICTLLFTLMHFPCSTTLITIKKETGSMKWTAVAFILPTLFGFAACFIVATVSRLLCA